MSLLLTGAGKETTGGGQATLRDADIILDPSNVAVMSGSPRYWIDSSDNKRHFQFGSNRPVCILPGPTAENGLYCAGVAGQDASIPDAASFDVDGESTLIWAAKIQLDDYANGGNQRIMSQFSSGTTGSWSCFIGSTGNLGLTYVDDDGGASNEVATSTAAITTVINDGDAVWVRWVFSPGLEAISFSYSLEVDENTYNNISWTALGSGTAIASTANIQNSAEDIQFGARRDSNPADVPKGWIYRAIMRKGLVTPTVMADVDFTAESTGTASFTEDGPDANTVTVNPLATTSNDPKWLAHSSATYNPYNVADRDYIYFPGVAANRLDLPDSATNSVTGDFSIAVVVQMDDWTPSATMTLASKWAATGNQKSWAFSVNTTGNLVFTHSEDGSASETHTSTATPGFSDGSPGFVAATFLADNGASGHDVEFYKSSNGISWAQVGTTVTTAGTSSLYDGTASVQIGTLDSSFNPLLGAVIAVTGYSGIPTVVGGAGGESQVFGISTISQTWAGVDTTHADQTDGTWTVTRPSTGRKLAIVDEDKFMTGTDDYFEHPTDTMFNFDGTTDFTVAGSLISHDVSNSAQVMGTLNSPTTDGWAIGTFGALSLITLYESSTQAIDTGASIVNSTRHVLAGVRTAGTNCEVYVDAVSAAASATNPSLDSTTAVPARIGAISDGTINYYDQEIIKVILYKDRALSDTDVSTIQGLL